MQEKPSSTMANVQGTWKAKLVRIITYALKQRKHIHIRLAVAQLIVSCLPFHVAPPLRTLIYRWAGFTNISKTTYILDKLDLRGRGDLYPRLHMGDGSNINHSCHIDLNAP